MTHHGTNLRRRQARLSMPFGDCAAALMTMLVVTPASAGTAPEMMTPEIFAPGVISGGAHESAPAFSPDGGRVFFGRSSSELSFILTSERTRSGWSDPAIASFSGRWLDMEPAIAPDGSYLIFVSNRPAVEGGEPIDGEINGVAQPGKGANLWRVDREAGGWSEPVRLPDIINSNSSVYAPSIAADGTLYFMQPAREGTHFQLFSARRTAGGYEPPTALPFSDGSASDVDPAVAPDNSFLVFGSSRRENKSIDLFISFRGDDGWADPQYLGGDINTPKSDAEPRLGPDGRTLLLFKRAPAEGSLADTRENGGGGAC